MRHWAFTGEARWLLVVSLAFPLVGFLLAIVVPALARWFGWR